MAERITQEWIAERIKKTIDQYFQEYKYMSEEYVERTKDTVVGAVLQVALHQLPTEKYFEIKQYCYDIGGGKTWRDYIEIYQKKSYTKATDTQTVTWYLIWHDAHIVTGYLTKIRTAGRQHTARTAGKD